ncbi:hypothetical protein DPMN_164186 [Dreissena polymorpha]|uniref:Uncharacterized protein n=1 Tax=Dreissena polymorpha TaxID=45954 RepID=A0A9D4ET82_DREPO|nr:hypothetical protein DPMN_164186 [Dreissena polymorpha]
MELIPSGNGTPEKHVLLTRSQNGTYTFWEWHSREIRIIDTVTERHFYLLGMALQRNTCWTYIKYNIIQYNLYSSSQLLQAILSLGKYVYSHPSPVHQRPYKLVLPSMHYTDLSLVPNHEVCAHFIDRAPAQQRLG